MYKFDEWMAELSGVWSVKKAELTTQPCSRPVSGPEWMKCGPNSHHLKPVGEEVSDPEAQSDPGYGASVSSCLGLQC